MLGHNEENSDDNDEYDEDIEEHLNRWWQKTNTVTKKLLGAETITE